MTFDLPDAPPKLPSRPEIDAEALWPSRSDIGALLALTLVYAVVAVVGLQWTTTPGLGALVWPAAGVGIAGLLIGGVRLWPAILVGRCLAAWLTVSPQPWWGELLVAVGAVLGAAIPAAVILRRGGFNPMLASLSDVCWLGVLGGLGGGVISAVTGVIALGMSGMPPQDLPALFVGWTLGFAAGALTLGPLILAWSVKESWREPLLSWAHLAACIAVTAVLVWLVWLRPLGFARSWHLYPVLIWSTIAFNARGSSVLLSLIALGSTAGAAQGLGPNGDAPLHTRMLLPQQFVLVTAATTLVLAAVADERRATRKLELANRAHRREIAARERAETHRRLLTQELNHRVKNTLATVQSMIGQTLRSGASPEEAAQSLTSRIVALAQAHDVLTRENWDGADLSEIFAAAMEPFAPPDARRVEAEGPAVRLQPTCALAIAMALHELATNAVKYGALSTPEGKVEVDWATRDDGWDRLLEIHWRESGGPAVEPPTRKGFGSRLLERGLPTQLNGTVSLDYRPDGLHCTIVADLGHDGGSM